MPTPWEIAAAQGRADPEVINRAWGRLQAELERNPALGEPLPGETEEAWVARLSERICRPEALPLEAVSLAIRLLV
jgi:hypothetical protein